MYTTPRGIYDEGKIRIIEPFNFHGKHDILITIIKENEEKTPLPTFSKFRNLSGILSSRTNGSIKHDAYIYEKKKQDIH